MSKTILHFVLGSALLSSAAALNAYLHDPVYLNYSTVDRQLFRWEFYASQHSVRIRFNAHDRIFHLILRPLTHDSSPFSEEMSVIEDGVSYNINPDKFIYEGSVKGDPKSIVYGSLFDGVFDGQIFLSDGNSFTVEKSTKYYSTDERPDGYHSVIYHDNKEYMNNFVGSGRRIKSGNSIDEEFTISDFPTQQSNNKAYERDSEGRYNARKCSMHLQVDHKLYQEVQEKEGFRDPTRTREELVALLYVNIRTANDIFRPTNFNGIRGINFEVKRITINTGADCSQDKCKEYTDHIDYANEFLVLDHSEFCLAYLMTFRHFGTVGGSAVRALPGYRLGACAPLTFDDNFSQLSGNIGFVSLNQHGHRLPPRMTQAALTHELGHSLGAGHDGMEEDGGNPEGTFLMYPSADLNDKPNRYKLSPLSIAEISAVLDEMLKNEPADSSKILAQPPQEHRGPKRNCLQALHPHVSSQALQDDSPA